MDKNRITEAVPIRASGRMTVKLLWSKVGGVDPAVVW
jgi:hypothetical protein